MNLINMLVKSWRPENNIQSHKYVELVAKQVVKLPFMMVGFVPSIRSFNSLSDLILKQMQGLNPQVQKADIWRDVCKC